MGVVPYFPGLARKATKLIFWRALKRRALGARVKLKYLRRMRKLFEYCELL